MTSQGMHVMASHPGLLPVTINGIGLVDATFVYLAAWYGLNFEVAVATMLLIRGSYLFLAVLVAAVHFEPLSGLV